MGAIDDLIAKYSPEQGVIEYHLPDGEVLKFRVINSYGEMKQVTEDAAKWYARLNKLDAKMRKTIDVPPSPEDAIAAYAIHKFAIEPEITLPQAVKMTRAPWLTQGIMQILDEGNKAYFRKQVVDDVEEQKKILEQMNGTVSASKSRLKGSGDATKT